MYYMRLLIYRICSGIMNASEESCYIALEFGWMDVHVNEESRISLPYSNCL